MTKAHPTPPPLHTTTKAKNAHPSIEKRSYISTGWMFVDYCWVINLIGFAIILLAPIWWLLQSLQRFNPCISRIVYWPLKHRNILPIHSSCIGARAASRRREALGERLAASPMQLYLYRSRGLAGLHLSWKLRVARFLNYIVHAVDDDHKIVEGKHRCIIFTPKHQQYNNRYTDTSITYCYRYTASPIWALNYLGCFRRGFKVMYI